MSEATQSPIEPLKDGKDVDAALEKLRADFERARDTTRQQQEKDRGDLGRTIVRGFVFVVILTVIFVIAVLPVYEFFDERIGRIYVQDAPWRLILEARPPSPANGCPKTSTAVFAAEYLKSLLGSVVLPVVTLVIGYYFGREQGS